jgi:hypothetical protein
MASGTRCCRRFVESRAGGETSACALTVGRCSLLSQVSAMKVPQDKMISLYEQVVKEMVEARELDTARALLRSTVPMAMLKEEDADRCDGCVAVPVSAPCSLSRRERC